MRETSTPGDHNRAYYDADQVVEEYATMFGEGLFDRERRIVEAYFDAAAGPALDLGCGAGRTTRALEREGFDVVGLDVSAPMVRRARGQVGSPLVIADAARLPVPDDSFAHVLFSYNGLDYVPRGQRPAVLDEVARVLRPGGLFAFSSHNLLNRLVADPRYPSTVRDRLGFWWRNLKAGHVGDARKLEVDSSGSTIGYYGTPWRQRRALRAHGFADVAVVPRGGRLSRYFGPWLYYVARLER